MKILGQMSFGGIAFGKHLYGIVVKPYETYRNIVNHGSQYELAYLVLMISGYFALASLVKTATFRPYLLSKKFVLLSGSSAVGVIVVVMFLWTIGRLFGGRGGFGRFLLAWGYTLVPTVMWFLATSILYVILPPPRTSSVEGVVFSLLYLVFSVTLLFWKSTLVYLVFRFGLRMDFESIVKTSIIAIPCLGLYSVIMYRLGIYKIPFL